MGLSINGTDITFEGEIRVVNGFNPDTGVAYLVLTPSGGFGTLPFFATGDPGLPPEFDEITVVEVAPGDALPTPNPATTIVSPGGPGQASHLKLKFYIHAGADGVPGSFSISSATDLSGTPDASTDGYALLYRNSDGSWVMSAQKVGGSYIPSVIASTAYNATATRILAACNIPAQPFDWRPKCFGSTVVTGSVDTRVDLVARLNDASSGAQLGRAKGVAGAAPPPMTLIPAAPAGVAIPGSYGKVLAGNAATVYLVAEQKAPSSNSWSTPADPDTTFWVDVAPLL